MKKNSIWFLGGLSGGHIYPLFNLLQQKDMKNNSDSRYYFFIPKNDLIESILSSQMTIKFHTIILKYSKPYKSLSVLFFLFDSIVIFFKIVYYCFKNKPNKMYSTGGYFSLPFAVCAWIFDISFAVYHLDLIPGVAGKIIGKFSNVTQCIIHEKTRRYIYNKNILVVPYPIRYSVSDKKNQNECKLFLNKSYYYIIFILGGSQGSQEINEFMISILPILKNKKIYIIHQTGKNQQDYITRKYNDYKIDFEVFDYCHDLIDFYNAADLIISRAGAGTIAEIDFFRKLAFVIPLQGAASNHQVHNAQLYAQNNKLITVILDKKSFITGIKQLIENNNF